MDLPMTTGLLSHALEKENEQLAFSLWNGIYPRMIAGQIPWKSFEEYKTELFKPKQKVSNKTTDEILSEMLRVVNSHEKGVK